MNISPRLVRRVRILALVALAAFALHACCTVPLPGTGAKFGLSFVRPVKIGLADQCDFVAALNRHHAIPDPLTKIFFNGIKIPVPFTCIRTKKVTIATADAGTARDGGAKPDAIHVGQMVYFAKSSDLQGFLNDIKVQPPDR